MPFGTEDYEKMLCGVILLNPDLIKTTRLTPHDFGDNTTSRLFKILKSKAPAEITIDSTLAQFVKSKDSSDDPYSYLEDCISMAPAVDSETLYHVERTIIREQQKSSLEKLPALSEDILREYNEPDRIIQEIKDYIEKVDRRKRQLFDDAVDISSAVEDVFEFASLQTDNPGDTPESYLSTGIKDIERITHGFAPGDFVVITGDAKAGKTTLMIHILLSSIGQGESGYFLSMEMTVGQLMLKMVCNVARVDYGRVIWGYVNDEEWKRMAKAKMWLEDQPLYIECPAGWTVLDARQSIYKKVEENDVQFVCIDYLQLFNNPNTDMMDEFKSYSYASKVLREVAKDTGVVIFLISRQNREGEHYGTSDLKYHIDTEISIWMDDDMDQGERYISIPRCRSGPGGKIKAMLEGEQSRIEFIGGYDGG